MLLLVEGRLKNTRYHFLLNGDIFLTSPFFLCLHHILLLFFFNSYFIYLFIYFWLCWVFSLCEGFL